MPSAAVLMAKTADTIATFPVRARSGRPTPYAAKHSSPM